MATLTQDLKTQLDLLSIDERAELADYLLRSLDSEADPEAEAAWAREIARREAEIRSSSVTGRPAAEVLAELRKGLG